MMPNPYTASGAATKSSSNLVDALLGAEALEEA